MAEKRTVRFVKWLIKVVISYAVFIGIGWLLGRIPAERIGLSEDMFFDLRMFFMLFGPIYLSLIVKIVLTILAAIKHKENDTAEQNRGVLLAVTAILMKEYSVGRRSICIRGIFTRKTKDAYGTHQKNAFSKTLWIPRTFPVEQERILLDFLRKA